MAQMPNQQMMQFPTPPPGRGPQQIATVIGQWVVGMAKTCFWLVCGVAVLATGFLALRVIWFSVKLVLEAVGGI